ncbi:thymidylate kinase [Spinactinospora alkalitolerans]|uniref:Thymidylate kinase n=1 Tax=Spinactinospora alkalitolerans TaxID=687207 RepID=A0A852TXR2_9ACTN|nr:dTMP kinase [Spinactinospora alkalitolerans]NYE48077.1 thymidylate kinase [Spinactinospora alkalitolerans]
MRLTEIRPALAEGRLVLCDRYIASSLVLQAGIDRVPKEFVQGLNAHANPPDLNVILTAPAEVLHGRLAARGSHGRFENDPANTDREVTLYREVIPLLEQAGITTLVVDTAPGVEKTISHLASTIGALWSQKHQEPAA